MTGKENRRELTPAAKARIASQAQAAAHRALRERHPALYQVEYQRAKRELTERETGRG